MAGGEVQDIPRAGMDLFEAIYTTRAMRRLKAGPIPDAVLRAILDATIRAPNGGNAQTWAFVVVRDPAVRLPLAAVYKQCLESVFEPGGTYARAIEQAEPDAARPLNQMKASALYLARHAHEVPVLVVACLRMGARPREFGSGAGIYPAVQNLLLAARAFGIGGTLTTIHRTRQDEVRDILGIPSDVETAAIVPLGYPLGRWAVAPRDPVEQVVFTDRWGQALGGEPGGIAAQPAT